MIQSTAIDVLQVLISRGEISNQVLQTVQAEIVKKLFFCVHTGRLDIQNNLLHILHTILSAAHISNGDSEISSDADENPTEAETRNRDVFVNSLLIQTLVDGVALPSNRSLAQHWFDFALNAIQQFQPHLQSVVLPLIESIQAQLRTALASLISTREQESFGDVVSVKTDAEMIMLLNALERLIQFSLAGPTQVNTPEADTDTSEKLPSEQGGILGYMSNVFGADMQASIMDRQHTVSTT